MVKKREKSLDKKIEDFGNAADKDDDSLDPNAPRGKKNGGTDKLIPFNTYEDNLVVEAAADEGRTVVGFIRNAAVKAAKEVVSQDQ